MKKKIQFTFILSILSLCIWSCEDVIDLEVKQGVPQLVVDAWLTDGSESQEIKLTISQPYFEKGAPAPALGATVIVFEEDSTAHTFLDLANNGVYVNNDNFLKEGGRYGLFVSYNGEEFVSISQKNRVPKIDSIAFENFEFPFVPNDSTPEKGFLGQFYAKDFDGEGDTYWVRTTKNNKRNNDPARLTIAYDASFSPGAGSDGLMFILPIRQSINDGLYLHGDTVKVELWSITNEAYGFLFQVRQESGNGGIFATPPANIPTNIINRNDESNTKALGFFGISAVSRMSIIVDSTKAKPMR